MAVEYTDSQLDSMSKDELKFVILTLQAQLKDLNSNMEMLIEQLRINRDSADIPKHWMLLTDSWVSLTI